MPDEEGEPLPEWEPFRITDGWWGVFRVNADEDSPPEAVFGARAQAEAWLAALVPDDEEGDPGPDDCAVMAISCLTGLYRNAGVG